jgi:hypothetical protein
VKNLKDLWQRAPEMLDSIGGEHLVGSGFAHEQPDEDFAGQEASEEREEWPA